MRELVGTCSCCGKTVYCLDGFFYGILTKDKKIVCLDCHQQNEGEKNPQN